MSNDRPPAVAWTIHYVDFFRSRLRRKLLPLVEMPARDRPFRLFTTSNDVISTHVRGGGTFEAEVLGMIDAIATRHDLRTGVALDIGANIGNHAVWMAQRFKQVIAFEPSPAIALVLRANALMNSCSNLDVCEVALSDRTGSARLVTRREDHIGTIELDETGISAEGGIPPAEVALQPGDDALAGRSLAAPVSFIKMDIEGAEVRALRGLRQTLESDHPVICFEARNPAEGEGIRAALREAGYSWFFSIDASRLKLLDMLSPRTWMPWQKRYTLAPLEAFENRHYSAVFAWTRDLR